MFSVSNNVVYTTLVQSHFRCSLNKSYQISATMIIYLQTNGQPALMRIDVNKLFDVTSND